MKIEKIKVMLMAEDMERAIAFYRGLFGIEPAFSSEDWTEIPIGDMVLALHGGKEGSEEHPTGLSVQVEAIDGLAQEVESLGGNVLSGPTRNEGEPIILAEFLDSEGNRVMATEYVGQAYGVIADSMNDSIKVLSVGAGFMATLHARAYAQLDGVENVGIVTRRLESSAKLAEVLGGEIPRFTDFEEALEKTAPDAVAISTYTDSHYDYVSTALKRGLHVFVEKPLAESMEESRELFDLAGFLGTDKVFDLALMPAAGKSENYQFLA